MLESSSTSPNTQSPSYAYGEWVIKHANFVIVVSLIFAILAGVGMSRLQFNPDSRVFFSEDNPELRALEHLEQTYTKTDNFYIAIESKNGNIFTPEMLQLIAELTEDAWQTPYSIRVDSLANYQHTEAANDELVVGSLFDLHMDINEALAARVGGIAKSKPFLVNRLISEDSAVTGINITVLKPDNDHDAVYEIVEFGKALVADYRERYPNANFYTTGGTIFDVAFAELPDSENAVLVPLMLVLILMVVGLALKSIWATVLVFLLIVLSVAMAMGLSGWANIMLSAGTSGAPVIIPTLSVAHCVHLLVAIRQKMSENMNKKDAIIESLRVNIPPIFVTSVTTAAGFLSLNFSDSPPFHALGNIVAIGVLIAFVLAVTLLPAILSKLTINAKPSKPILQPIMQRLGVWVVSQHKVLFWVTGLGIITFALGTTRIVLDDNFVKYFDDRFEIRQHSDFIEDRLTGLNALEYSLTAPNEGGISDPAYLAAVEEFIQWFHSHPKVTNVGGISTIIKELNMSMNNGDPSFNKVPENRELAAQYLLLYEMSLPYGLDLSNTIDFSKTESRVIALLQGASSVDLRKINGEAEQWLADNHPDLVTKGSGLSLIFAYISERNIASMLYGSLAALAAISFILIVALRSLRMGLISLIPNLMPALMALGLWGYLVGEAGLATAVVVAVTLGIVVDDTVHFLSKYLLARRELGMTPEQAITHAFSTVGVALLITSVALMCGFMVLYLSGFKVNAEMGLLSAVTIGLALLLDYLFLPTLLLAIDKNTSDVNTV